MAQSNLVSIRFWGELGCWTRPELKTERCSYPVMTPSGARGALEAIFYEPQMYYLVDQILVVRRGRWISFKRNEVTDTVSLRNVTGWMDGRPVERIAAGGGVGTQRNTLALADVEYVVTAEVRLSPRAQPPRDNIAKYVELIRKRAEKGKCFHRPCLGMREFAADFEWVEDPSRIAPVDRIARDELGLVLYDVFDPRRRAEEPGLNVKPGPVFFRASIVENRLDCHPERVELLRSTAAEGGVPCC